MTVQDKATPLVVLISDDSEREVAFCAVAGASFIVEHYRDVEIFASTSRPAPELIVVERRPSGDIASDVTKLLELFGYAAPPVAVVDGAYDPDVEAAALTAGAQEYWVRQMREPVLRHRISTCVLAERQRRSDRVSASEAFRAITDPADASAPENPVRIQTQENAILASLVEHSPCPLVFRDVEGRHLMLNAQTAHVIGRPVDEILGWTLEELGRPWDEIGAHERAVIEAKAAITQRRVVEDAHGHSTDRQLTKFPVLDEAGNVFAVGTVDVDLTSLGQAQRALRAQEENFRALVEGSVQGIVIHRDFVPLFVNTSFARMHGFDSPDDILALESFQVLIAPNEHARLESYAQKRLRTNDQPVHYEYEALRRDGSAMTLQTTASVVSWRGETAIQATVVDITDLKQARSDLEIYQTELRRLASELSLAEERERRRIATELHDGAVQNLGLASIHIGSLMRKTTEPVNADTLEAVRSLVAQSVRELRTLMSELSPPMLYETGLPPALQWLANHFETHHALDCSARVADTVERLSDELTVLLFQAARELLMNVVKHANASHAEVLFQRSGSEVELQVHDDGSGMDPARLRDGRSPSGGFGLFSMRERVQLGGGSFNVESGHQGTVIKIRMPSSLPSK